MIEYLVDAFPPDEDLNRLFAASWGQAPTDHSFAQVLSRSLTHVCAFSDAELVGFVNVAWDGGAHAFLLDTCVLPGFRHQGIASALVRKATEAARDRGAEWLHVDYESHLAGFYAGCGFRPTEAGLIDLTDGR